MFGPKSDNPGKCNAQLHLADDYGDNVATMKCQLETNHEGRHVDICRNGQVKIEWEGNDSYEALELEHKSKMVEKPT